MFHLATLTMIGEKMIDTSGIGREEMDPNTDLALRRLPGIMAVNHLPTGETVT